MGATVGGTRRGAFVATRWPSGGVQSNRKGGGYNTGGRFYIGSLLTTPTSRFSAHAQPGTFFWQEAAEMSDRRKSHGSVGLGRTL